MAIRVLDPGCFHTLMYHMKEAGDRASLSCFVSEVHSDRVSWSEDQQVHE